MSRLAGGSGSPPVLLDRGHGQPIASLVLRMLVVPADPVTSKHRASAAARPALPQLEVLHTSRSRPRFHPLAFHSSIHSAEPLHDVLAVGVEIDPARLVEGLEALDHRDQLHAVVRGGSIRRPALGLGRPGRGRGGCTPTRPVRDCPSRRRRCRARNGVDRLHRGHCRVRAKRVLRGSWRSCQRRVRSRHCCDHQDDAPCLITPSTASKCAPSPERPIPEAKRPGAMPSSFGLPDPPARIDTAPVYLIRGSVAISPPSRWTRSRRSCSPIRSPRRRSSARADRAATRSSRSTRCRA